MTRVAPLAFAGFLLCLSPAPSGAAGPWQYVVTGPGGWNQIGSDQIGQVLYFQLDATVPDYVWGNVRVDFDPAMLECVSIEESPYVEGFWTAWVAEVADPAYGGGGVAYSYDDTGLGSDWASVWVATYGPGAAGPVASYDNAAGVIRFYTMSNAGGYAGSVPLRIGFRVEQPGVAVFTTSANDWTMLTWRPEDLPYRLTSEVTIQAPIRVVTVDVLPGGDGNCSHAPSFISVAILAAPDFDVTAVDVATVSLEGMPVATVGKDRRLRASYQDVDGDGLTDLLVTIANTRSLSGAIAVRLTADLLDGTQIEGSDLLCAP
jgi:hypothetical protein